MRRAEVAEAAGVVPSAITLYEQGRSNVSEDVLAKLAAFLGVTPAYLRYGVTDMKKPAEVGGLAGDYTAGAVKLSEAALDRAEIQAEIDEAALAAKSAPRVPQRKRGGKQGG